MNPQTKRDLSIAAVVAAVFVVMAVVGSAFTSKQMDRTADQHATSAGRSEDPKPNGLQETQNDQNDKAARGPSTTGSEPDSAVPPATR